MEKAQQAMNIFLLSSLSISISLCFFLPVSSFYACFPRFGGMYSHGGLCCFKCADFIIRSENNSCDQAGFFLVGIAYCFGTPFFLPPLISITSSFFSASATFPFYFRSRSPAVCSVCRVLLSPYYYFWALEHQLYNFSHWSGLMKMYPAWISS